LRSEKFNAIVYSYLLHLLLIFCFIFCFCAGIFKHSKGVRNREGIGLSYRPATGRLYIGWRNWFLGIDSWAPSFSLFL
jgi:hypothetical protein